MAHDRALDSLFREMGNHALQVVVHMLDFLDAKHQYDREGNQQNEQKGAGNFHTSIVPDERMSFNPSSLVDTAALSPGRILAETWRDSCS